MWKTFNELKEQKINISGWYTDNVGLIPYNVKLQNNNVLFTKEKIKEDDISKDIFMTSAGEIDLYDDGEFGGHLEIGGKFICKGNFSQIFEVNNHKYVLDSLKHMTCGTFRLIEIFDNGTVEVLYDADKLSELHKQFYSLENIDYKNLSDELKKQYQVFLDYQIGLDGYFIDGTCVKFLCSGTIFDLEKAGKDRYNSIIYLLVFDTETKQFYEMDLTDTLLSYSYVTSIVIHQNKLYIGCDKMIIEVDLETKVVKYFTDIDDSLIDEVVNYKKTFLERSDGV